MTVSKGMTWVRIHGDENAGRAHLPHAFHQLSLLGDVMGDGVETYFKTLNFRDGTTVRVWTSHGLNRIDIWASGGVGKYRKIEEEYQTIELYMDPVLYFDSATEERLDSGDQKCRQADEFSENACYSQRLFERLKIYREYDSGDTISEEIPFTRYGTDGTLIYDTKNESKNYAVNKVCYPANKTRSHGLHHCYKSWSKTLDKYTAHAILYYNSYVRMNMWCIAVDVGKEAYAFQAASTSPISYHWPSSGYLDVVWCSNTDPYNTTATYKCFDLWKEGVVEDSGKTVDHYFVSCIGDPDDYIQVWDLTTGEYQPVTLHTAYDAAKAVWEANPVGSGGIDGYRSRHIRHIGLVKRTLYWAWQDHYYGAPVGANGTIRWESDNESGTVDLGGTECGIQFAILNEFTQEIEWMDDIACQVCDWEDPATEGPTLHYSTSSYTSGGLTTNCRSPGASELASYGAEKTGSCGEGFPYTCGACSVARYTDFKTDDGVLSAHVVPAGFGAKYEITVANGEVATECADDDDYSAYEETTTEHEFGVFNEDYAQSAWPYYPSFAIVQNAVSCDQPVKETRDIYEAKQHRHLEQEYSFEMSDEKKEDRCTLYGNQYSMVLDNNGVLHDNAGNEFKRKFEDTEVGLFFMKTSLTTKTRQENV